MPNASPLHGESSAYRGFVVAAVLLLMAGTAAVLLSWSGEATLERAQAAVPFPLVQPARLPAGMVLVAAFVSPPPPEAEAGVWMVQLFYGSHDAPRTPAPVVVWEQWSPRGIDTIASSPTAKTVRLGPGPTGYLDAFSAANGARYAQVSFAEGGRAYQVTGLRVHAAILLRIARSLAVAARAAATQACGDCQAARAVASTPRGSGWTFPKPASG